MGWAKLSIMYNILLIQAGVFTIFSDLFCFNTWESTTWFSLVILLNFFFFHNKCHLSGHDVILCNDVNRINFSYKIGCFQVYQSQESLMN